MISAGDPGSPNGQELLTEFMQYGRQRPFEEIVRRYAGMVYNVCLRITKDKHDAEDATQAVFLTLALQAKRGAQIKALGPWLQQVAKRLSLDLRRAKGRRKNREQRHHLEQDHRRDSIADDALPPADLDEIKTILHEELHKLPAKYRLPLVLHYFGGLTREEMAVELGCKPSTLGVRIFRGRALLAGRLSGRGVRLSTGSLGVALAFAIKSVVSDALVSSTSHAASALACGHDGIGLVSSRVIGLTRRAVAAATIGKFKVAAAVSILACTSLGAGAKAFGMLPKIDVSQIISDQVQRLIRPFVEPFSIPIQADATPKRAVAAKGESGVAFSMAPTPATVPPLPEAWRVAPLVSPVAPAPLNVASNTANPAASNGPVAFRSETAESVAPTVGRSSPSLDASVVVVGPMPARTASSAGGVEVTDPGGAGGAGSNNVTAATAGRKDDPAALAKSSSALLASGGVASAMTASNDLYVPLVHTGGQAGVNPYAAGNASISASANVEFANPGALRVALATPAAAAHARIESIPAVGGSVTLSDGQMRGWGKVDRTGTLDVSGSVVADGAGIDRTLNLASFSAIRNDTDNSSSGGTAGWYAENHGRLTLPLRSSKDGKSLTWGEDANDPTLDLVNSVRLTSVDHGQNLAPTLLWLLSSDRHDVPNLAGLAGVPIGLWQVDPTTGELAAADLTVRYDDSLIGSLGASESSAALWTYGGGAWTNIDGTSLALDTADHLISGEGTNFSFFAVSVTPGEGVDPSQFATHASVQDTSSVPSVPSVPEPACLGLLALAAGALARRRRRG